MQMGAVLLCCGSTLAFAKSPAHCYVIGDTSDSKPMHTYGSQQNPYGSLGDVQADPDCVVINVLYSDIPLDGGIVLKDGQRIEGKKSKKGALPKITNSAGIGIILARNNRLKNLHVFDTWLYGIAGSPEIQFTGGDIIIQKVLVTGANQSGGFDAFGIMSSLAIAPAEDMKLRIKNSEIGEANAPSIGIAQLNGHADIRISNTTVRDQGHIPGGNETSPGIAIVALGISSIDAAVLNTSVSNIGDGALSNSDGLLLLNQGSGAMNVKVDGYHYSNPDGGGALQTSTGIEMGFFASSGGGSFNGTVKNSVIEDAWYTGIQILDQYSGGGNTLTAQIKNNQINNCGGGIQAFTSYTPFSSMYVDISDNTIDTTDDRGFGLGDGIEIAAVDGPANIFEARIEGNSVLNAAGDSLIFVLRNASVQSAQLDAGLGGLGSAGQNRIIGGAGANIVSDGFEVSAANNWWGSDTGPAVVVELNGGTVDVDPFLTTDPNPNP